MKVSPSADACPPQPPPSKPTREVTLMRLGLICVYLTGLSQNGLLLRRQVNQLKGSLGEPEKEGHIHSAVKPQVFHSQVAMPCHNLRYESSLSDMYTGIYMHTYIILPLYSQRILPGYKYVYIGHPGHFTSRRG